MYSLAKTLWMFLTGDDKGFDGAYNYSDSSHGLKYMDKYEKKHLVELEKLLAQATDNIPDNRPSISEFKSQLQNWLTIFNNPDESQASDWEFLKTQMANPLILDSIAWRDPKKIIQILNMIKKTNVCNHMLLSSMGGTEFSHAKDSYEKG